jgi:hypothetical protein
MTALRTRFIKGKGMVTEEVSSGDGTVSLDGSTGLSPFTQGVDARTASVTLTGNDVGMHTLSGSGTGASANQLTIVLPTPSEVPMAEYGFRMLDARSHVISSSMPGSAVRAFVPFTSSGSAAAPLVASFHMSMSAVVGSSVVVKSDGRQYLMLCGSGSHTFTNV